MKYAMNSIHFNVVNSTSTIDVEEANCDILNCIFTVTKGALLKDYTKCLPVLLINSGRI